MKRTLVILVTVIMVLLTATTAFAVTATVTADVLNLRKEPQGEIIGKVRYGEKVEVLNGPDRNGYYEISYKGSTYYAYGSYLNFGSELPDMPTVGSATQQQPSKKPGTATAIMVEPKYYFLDEAGYNPVVFADCVEKISIRTYATTKSIRKKWVPKGDMLIVLEPKITKGFVKVRTLDGEVEGFALASYLSLDPIEDIDYSAYVECEILDSEIEGVCWTIPEKDEDDE